MLASIYSSPKILSNFAILTREIEKLIICKTLTKQCKMELAYPTALNI